MIADRWGVTPSEVSRHYPCDDVVPEPDFQAWRGVTVRAAPEAVWPWVAQIRLAPYSYDWIDNLGHRSPRQLRGLPEPEAGQPFTIAFGGRPAGRILAVTPGEQLTARIMGTVMSYVLVPVAAPGRAAAPDRAAAPGRAAAPDRAAAPAPDAAQATRLLLKVVAARTRAYAPLLSVGDLIMARRQLLNLARLAEQAPAPGRPRSSA